jgi:serine/threonine protein phosphatase 1
VVRSLEAVLGNHDDKLLQRKSSVLHLIEALDREDWSWRPWVQSLPLMLEVGRYVVVHAGIHPTGDRGLTTRQMALTMRRWPDERPDHPFWWQVYQGRLPVLFGHDARRGHVRVDGPDGAPLIVGLDTGCVYGGSLSGWVVEEERLVQVKARRDYVSFGD